MRRCRVVLAGALLFLGINAVAASEWPKPMFLEPEIPNGNVTWIPTPYDYTAMAVIYEGTKGDIEIMRLSYKAEGADVPKIISGTTALGSNIAKDSSTSAPFFLQVTEPGDYEAGVERFLVRVSAPSDGSTLNGEVTLVLENVNDNPPTIDNPPSCLVEEEYTGITDCQFVVTDPDGGACYAKMLVEDTKFSLHLLGDPTPNCKTATFILHVDSKLDYETIPFHYLLITAEDNGQIGPNDFLVGSYYQERKVPFVVAVDDIPDEPPRWETIMPLMTVYEKTMLESRIRAIDGDYGLNWPIVYSLEFPNDGFDYTTYFSIHRETGLLSVWPINRDELQREHFRFTVVATEVPPRDKYPNFVAMYTSNDVVLVVNDLNDNLPMFEPVQVKYLEFPEENPFTDRSFAVDDPDLGDNGTFSVTLEENFWSANFLLIPSSGYQKVGLIVTALDPSLLDYEDPSWRVIELTIIAKERADETHTSKAVLHIELLDLLDEPPEFENEEYIVQFPENQPEGFVVVRTEAHDRDENDLISFSLKNSFMQIDDGGLITTVNANAFDYERESEIILHVIATDTGNMKDFCQVTIQLIDINDEQPTLLLPSKPYDIEEHAHKGERASYDIKATDPDTEAGLRFFIDWEFSTAYSQGVEVKDKALYQNSVKLADTKIGGSEWITYLVVANSAEFDWEVFDTLRLQITVVDLNTHHDYLHKDRSSATLTVNVIDINDNPPIFIDEEFRDNLTVAENTPANRIIGYLTATDADSPPLSQIRYSLEPTFPEELVVDKKNPRLTIDPETGYLFTTITQIDCDAWSTIIFKYEVTATDGLHATSEEIILYIEDENDEFPEVIKPEDLTDSASFKEHEDGLHLLSCIKGDDRDYSEAFHTISYYIEGDSNEYFEMESPCKPEEECCLWAKDGRFMDREVQETYVIDVFSRDNYEDGTLWQSNPGPTVKVTLTLEDINDSPPVFEYHDQPWRVSETIVSKDFKFFEVVVTDMDIGPNGEIECVETPEVTSVPERPEGLFKVKTVVFNNVYKCAVYATQPFSHPTETSYWGVYSLTLTAYDKGEVPLYGTGEYEIKVDNENLKNPIILYPENGTIIRLSENQDINNGRPLLDYNGNEIANFETEDLDDPSTPNGQVELVLTDSENGKTFDVREVGLNSGIFRLVMTEIPSKKVFHLTLQANDKAKVGKRYSTKVEIDVRLFEVYSTPTFAERETTVFFHENKTGLEEVHILPEAKTFDDSLEEAGVRPIFYYIIGGEAEYFILNQYTRELKLQKELDYEIVIQHKITVGATHHATQPPSDDFNENSILEVTVEVIDVNDMPPRFAQDVFPGAFSVEHDQGHKVIDLKAEDPETNPILTFIIIPGTIKAHSDSLKEFERDDAFLVNPSTGEITLNFSPAGRTLDGYFSFDVKVFDEAGDDLGHRDTASAIVFVLSSTHQMLF